MAATNTRSEKEIYGLGPAVTQADAIITGSRLPTAKQVLRCAIFHLEDGYSQNRTKYQAAKIVLGYVSPFYEKGGIPMLTEQACCQKMIKLLEENEKFRRIPRARRTSPSMMAKLVLNQMELSKTFALWSPNAEAETKNPEDIEFLKSMKTDRKATISGMDMLTLSKVKRKQEKITSEEKRRVKAARGSEILISTVRLDESSSSDDDIPLASYVPTQKPDPRPHRRVRTGSYCFIPPDIMKSPRLVSRAARMKMTPAQQAAFTEAFIEEAGGDPSKVCTSYRHADNSRRAVSHQIASKTRELWIPPKFASLHWDVKSLPTLIGQYEHEERLAITVGDSQEMKLLGIPSYKSGTDQQVGDIISNRTCELLQSWECSDTITNMVFDTTSSNTGHLTAACVSIQRDLGRPLLWSGCQHHVGELIVSHLFDDLKIETSKSPEVTLFTRLRTNWNLIPHQQRPLHLQHLNINNFPENVRNLVTEWRDEVIEMAQRKMEYLRDDYRELLELCVAYLNTDCDYVKFRRPGAVHKARWMGKLLYMLKLVLLEGEVCELPKGTITTTAQVPKLRVFVNFVALTYCQWWFRSSVGVDASWNTLVLYQNILKYRKVNELISASAIRSFNRHLWYLVGEMVPLSLFSTKVSNLEKRQIADKLLSVKPEIPVAAPIDRFGTGYGKPVFPSDINESSKLVDFIKQDSWFLFSILNLDAGFLTLSVDEWPDSEAYQSALCNVGAVNVVNDAAERGIKLSSDYLSSAKSEIHYQNVLQVVEHDRKQKPNLRKRNTEMTI